MSVFANHGAGLAERPRFRNDVLGIQTSSRPTRDEVLSGGVRQVDAAEWTKMAETTEWIDGEVGQLVRATTLLTPRYGVIPTRPEQQNALGRCQHGARVGLLSRPPESSTVLLQARQCHRLADAVRLDAPSTSAEWMPLSADEVTSAVRECARPADGVDVSAISRAPITYPSPRLLRRPRRPRSPPRSPACRRDASLPRPDLHRRAGIPRPTARVRERPRRCRHRVCGERVRGVVEVDRGITKDANCEAVALDQIEHAAS